MEAVLDDKQWNSIIAKGLVGRHKVKTSRTSAQDTGLKSNKPSSDFGELLLQEGR